MHGGSLLPDALLVALSALCFACASDTGPQTARAVYETGYQRNPAWWGAPMGTGAYGRPVMWP